MNSSEMIKQGYREARSPRLRATTRSIRTFPTSRNMADTEPSLVARTLEAYGSYGYEMGRW